MKPITIRKNDWFPAISHTTQEKSIRQNPFKKDICFYLESHLIDKDNNDQKSILNSYFTDLMGHPLEDLDSVDKFVFRFLSLGKGIAENEKLKVKETCSSLEELIGVSNTFALLIRVYQIACHLEKQEPNGASQQKIGNAKEFFSSELKNLIELHFEAYHLLDLEKLSFDKEKVSPSFLKNESLTLLRVFTLSVFLFGSLSLYDTYNLRSSYFADRFVNKIELAKQPIGEWYIKGLNNGKSQTALTVENYWEELLTSQAKLLIKSRKPTVKQLDFIDIKKLFRSLGATFEYGVLSIEDCNNLRISEIPDNRAIPAHLTHEAYEKMLLQKKIREYSFYFDPKNRPVKNQELVSREGLVSTVGEIFQGLLFNYYSSKIKYDPTILSSLSRKFIGTKNYQKLVIAAIEHSEKGYALLRADKRSFQDYEIMLKAVKKNGYLAALLGFKFLDNEEIFQAATAHTPFALRFFPRQKGKKIVEILLKHRIKDMDLESFAEYIYNPKDQGNEKELYYLKNSLTIEAPLNDRDYKFAENSFHSMEISDSEWSDKNLSFLTQFFK